MKVTMTSPFSGKTNSMNLDITEEQFYRWKRGELIQNVFPHLTPDEREFLMTGLLPAEFDGLFADDELTHSRQQR